MPRIFVYGTLKSGYRNNVLLAASTKVGDAVTEPLYRLYDCGSYPAMVEVLSGGVAVEGEVWEVDDTTMRRLDKLEGVPWLYKQGEVKLQGQDPVLGYFYQQDVRDLADIGGSWPHKRAA